MKYSLNNREDNSSEVCKQWYFRSSDVISGNFLTRLFPMDNSSSQNERSACIRFQLLNKKLDLSNQSAELS